jgi:predicted transcriptional regulator of viral defense system
MPEPGRKASRYWRKFDQAPVDEALANLATAQEGVFTIEQIAECGLSGSAVWSRRQSGRLHLVYWRVYSLVPPSLLSREGRWLAAVLACGPGAALSHRSAGVLLELRASDRSRIDVTIPYRSSRHHEGIAVHRSTALTAQDVTVVRNIPCTTIARTMLDIAEVIPSRQLERMFEQAEQQEVLNLSALQDQIERNPSRAGAARLRALISEYRADMGATWSELEADFKAMLKPTGVPMPQVNQLIVLDDGEPAIRADFYWPAHRVVVETDGYKFHSTRGAFERNRRNDQRLTVAGFRVVRMTHRQIKHQAEKMAAVIVRLLAAAPGP